jgi:4-amino-4-deoxy-L-arabinose transferase-like glycosyltransferase
MKFVLGFNLVLFLFRVFYVLYSPLDLTPEEAQYWDWSRHLDLSYYSKPPMVAYINFLTTSLLGNTELAVRITPIFLSFLMSVFIYLFVRRLFDERTALISSTLPQLSVGLAINSLLMTTDALLIFFWGLSLMVLWYALEKNNAFWWLLLGIFSGFAFLSKYSAVFLLPLALLYTSIYKRELLWSAKTYLSLLPPLFMSLPVLYWNYKHQFVSFKHVSTLATKQASLFNPSSFFEFLGGQLLLVSILPFFFMLKGWLLGWKDRRLGFLTVFSFPVFLFFLAMSLRKHVEANWSGSAYFGGFLLASYYLSKSRFLKPTYALSFVLFILLHFSPILDKVGLKNLLPPSRDPVKVAIGWELLGKEVSKLYTGQEIILSPRYQISAELAFYTEGNPRTYCINLGRRMNQYDLWRETMKNYIGKDGIYVDYSPIDSRVLEGFEGIIEHRVLPIRWRGEVIKEFHIYKLKNYEHTIKEEGMFEGY